jgi:hypothetical protein
MSCNVIATLALPRYTTTTSYPFGRSGDMVVGLAYSEAFELANDGLKSRGHTIGTIHVAV